MQRRSGAVSSPFSLVLRGIMGFTAWHYYAHARVPRTLTPSVVRPRNTPFDWRDALHSERGREGGIEAAANNAAKVSEIQLNHMLRLSLSLCLAVGSVYVRRYPTRTKKARHPRMAAGRTEEKEGENGGGWNFSNKNLNAANLSQEE